MGRQGRSCGNRTNAFGTFPSSHVNARNHPIVKSVTPCHHNFPIVRALFKAVVVIVFSRLGHLSGTCTPQRFPHRALQPARNAPVSPRNPGHRAWESVSSRRAYLSSCREMQGAWKVLINCVPVNQVFHPSLKIPFLLQIKLHYMQKCCPGAPQCSLRLPRPITRRASKH